MVKPGGTGSASTDVISARLAPLPPRRSFSSIGALGWTWSKSNTNGMRVLLASESQPRPAQRGPAVLREAIQQYRAHLGTPSGAPSLFAPERAVAPPCGVGRRGSGEPLDSPDGAAGDRSDRPAQGLRQGPGPRTER